MAKRSRSNDNPLDNFHLPSIDLDPDIKRGIFIVFVFAFGAVSLLSLLGLASTLGLYLARGLSLTFGWGKWLFPIILLVWGFLLYNRDKYWVKGANYVGLFLFTISFCGLLHLFISQSDWLITVSSGAGGGYLGLSIASVFNRLMGFWATSIILICLILVSLMLMFNATLHSIIGRQSILAKLITPLNFLFLKIFSRPVTSGDDEEEPVFDGVDEAEKEAAETAALKEAATGNFQVRKIRANTEIKEVDKNIKTDSNEGSGWKPSHVKIDLPLELLNGRIGKPTSGDIKNNSLVIQRTLENFGIPVEMGEVNVGPTVTQYTLKPAEGIKLSRITTLGNDLALALAAHPIRIEAPIPGRSLVGVEVPNQVTAVVGLREVLAGDSFKNRKDNLMVALGKDVSGAVWLDDLSKMPHLLVAGATNSGKSVCLNSIVVSLLYQNNPDDLRFIMVDPKRVELPVYNGIPHLLTSVITDVNKTINALKWCLNEMDRRFEILAKAGKRNIASYNEGLEHAGKGDRMPYLVFIIDELADLMVAAARDVEGGIIRLAQMARAVGIHLILATQRPSVDVITGLIKANMPARIAFSVASGIDSRTILDSLGAEKLLGRGDMLFSTATLSKPRRLQGAFVSDNEIKRVVNYIKEHGGEPQYVESIVERQKVRGIAGVGFDGGSDDDDELLEDAKEMVINLGKASASLLQRRLSIGYARAARLLDLLEQAGVVGQGNGAKPREILISKEEYGDIISQGVSGTPLHNRETAQAPESYLNNDEDEETGEDAEEDETENEGKKPGEKFNGDNAETDDLSEDELLDKIAEESGARKNKAAAGKPKPSDDDEEAGKYFAK